MTQWVLLDYGVGNLHSLQKALQAAGADTIISADPSQVVNADVAVLPGVGAFGHVMQTLAPVAQRLRERHAAGKPILGICIGHQVLYEGSDESTAPGVGILPGRVRKLTGHKIPHMGWNTLDAKDDLAAFDGQYVYYVHSFAAEPDGATVATTTYGAPFAAAIRHGNTWGYQFHPEKSSQAGQAILRATVADVEAVA